VPTVLGRVARHDHFVAEAGRNLVIATRAAIVLDRLVRLHVADVERAGVVVRAAGHPKRAQSTSANTTTSAIATIAMSLRRLTCDRNGLRPTKLR
jgi:hypothetical protein